MKLLYYISYNTVYFFLRIFFNYRVFYAERLIKNSPLLIIANHVSYLDPLAVGIAFKNEIFFLAKQSLSYLPIFGSLIFNQFNCIPINNHGNGFSIRNIIKLLKQGKQVLMFPEGTRSDTGDIGAARPGLGFILKNVNVPIQPIRVFGTYEAYPKNQNFFRYFPISVVVGEPIFLSNTEFSVKENETSHSYETRISDQLMKSVNDIQLPHPEYLSSL